MFEWFEIGFFLYASLAHYCSTRMAGVERSAGNSIQKLASLRFVSQSHRLNVRPFVRFAVLSMLLCVKLPSSAETDGLYINHSS